MADSAENKIPLSRACPARGFKKKLKVIIRFEKYTFDEHFPANWGPFWPSGNAQRMKNDPQIPLRSLSQMESQFFSPPQDVCVGNFDPLAQGFLWIWYSKMILFAVQSVKRVLILSFSNWRLSRVLYKKLQKMFGSLRVPLLKRSGAPYSRVLSCDWWNSKKPDAAFQFLQIQKIPASLFTRQRMYISKHPLRSHQVLATKINYRKIN